MSAPATAGRRLWDRSPGERRPGEWVFAPTASARVGGSEYGRSSLVFGTIAAESRRLIDETYDAFVQGFMPPAPQPDADSLEGLTAAILVGQEQMGANSRSTVGTATNA